MIFNHPMMMAGGGGNFDVIAAGTFADGNPGLVPSSVGAQVGDLIFVWATVNTGGPTGTYAITGGGASGSWVGALSGGYTYDPFGTPRPITGSYKILTGDTAVKGTGGFGNGYVVLRGPTSIVQVDTSVRAGTSITANFPAKDPTCIGLAALGYGGSAQNLVMPTGWSKVLHGTGSDFMQYPSVPDAASHDETFTGVDTGGNGYIWSFEIRKT